MLKNFALLGLVVALALAPIGALAASTAPGAQSTSHQAHKPTRSYRSEMRHRSNQSRARARAGAEHMRTMRPQ